MESAQSESEKSSGTELIDLPSELTNELTRFAVEKILDNIDEIYKNNPIATRECKIND